MAEKQNHDFHEDGNDLADRLIEKLKKETEKIHSADSDAEGDSVSKVGAEDEKERLASDDESDLNELLKKYGFENDPEEDQSNEYAPETTAHDDLSDVETAGDDRSEPVEDFVEDESGKDEDYDFEILPEVSPGRSENGPAENDQDDQIGQTGGSGNGTSDVSPENEEEKNTFDNRSDDEEQDGYDMGESGEQTDDSNVDDLIKKLNTDDENGDHEADENDLDEYGGEDYENIMKDLLSQNAQDDNIDETVESDAEVSEDDMEKDDISSSEDDDTDDIENSNSEEDLTGDGNDSSDEYFENTASEEDVKEMDEENEFISNNTKQGGYEELAEEVSKGKLVNNANTGDIDDTDVNLMYALGMTDKLKEKVSQEKLSQYETKFNSEQNEIKEVENRKVPFEYTDPSQNAAIADEYKRKLKVYKFKKIFSIIFAAILLFYENMTLLGIVPSGAFDSTVYPVVFIMIDLQIMLFVCAFAYAELLDGLKGIFTGKPNGESIPALLTIISFVYTIVSAIVITPPTEPRLFNSAVALSCVIAIIFKDIKTRREIFSFNVVSSKKSKYVLHRVASHRVNVEAKAFGEDEGTIGDMLKIEKSNFVDGFFARNRSHCQEDSSMVRLDLILAAVLSVLAAVMGLFFEVGLTDALIMFEIAASISFPVCTVLAFTYPLYRANYVLYDDNSSIIGENSLTEYSGVSVVSFDDEDAFPATDMKIKNIKIYNNYRIDRVIYYGASLFNVLGGPLKTVFKNATSEDLSDDITLTEVGDDFVDAVVNGRRISFCSGQALSQKGIDISEEVVAEDEGVDPSLSVMYMVFEDILVAKMNILYVLDDDFIGLIKGISGSGLHMCLRTFDPNLNDERISKLADSDAELIKVVKYLSIEEKYENAERCDGGIVSRGSPIALLKSIATCKKVLKSKDINSSLAIASIVTGVLISTIMLVAGAFGSITSLVVILHQLLWLIVAWIVSLIRVK